ncbi:GNAT family N-acetyltransferase, partial [Streptomyces sp. JAC18]
PKAHNTGMVAAVRARTLRLDYQIEEGALVITARLDGATAQRSAWPRTEPVTRSGATSHPSPLRTEELRRTEELPRTDQL